MRRTDLNEASRGRTSLPATSEELRRAIRSVFKTIGAEVFVCKTKGWDATLIGPPIETRKLEADFQALITQLRRDFHLVEQRSTATSAKKSTD